MAVTIFLPWVSVAKTMGELGRLECWVGKQANLTSNGLLDLLSDEEITRKETLQNRAATDYTVVASTQMRRVQRTLLLQRIING